MPTQLQRAPAIWHEARAACVACISEAQPSQATRDTNAQRSLNQDEDGDLDVQELVERTSLRVCAFFCQ